MGKEDVSFTQEILWERKIGQSLVIREKLSRADGSQIHATTIYADKGADYNLLIDPRFKNLPIELEPGGLLIDQEATREAWGNPAGMTPENFLEISDFPEGTIAIPPTNAGWQIGSFWVQEGKLVMIPNDKEALSGEFDIIGYTGNGWVTQRVTLKDGSLNGRESSSLSMMSVGLSMPLIVEDGEIVPQFEILQGGDPRALADFRNFIDFSGDKEIPGKFWALLRKFMPDTGVAARRITNEGQVAVIRVREDVTSEEIEEFRQIIEKSELGDHWHIVKTEGRPGRVVICAKLPPNRDLPVVGIGHDMNGKLLVTVVDGRQSESTGATIDELAQIMRDGGAKYAGLGSAGGDAVAVANTEYGTEILSSPSNKGRVTRPAPSVLVIS